MAGQNQTELIEARIAIAKLETQVEHLTASVADLSSKLDAVLCQLSEAKGGWRTLMLVGGAASTLGAGLTWMLNHLPKG